MCIASHDREPVCGFHTFCDFPLTALGFINKAKKKLMKFISNILHQNNTMTKLTCPKSKQRMFLSLFYVCSFLIGQYKHVKKYPRICLPQQVYLLSNSFFFCSIFCFIFSGPEDGNHMQTRLVSLAQSFFFILSCFARGGCTSLSWECVCTFTIFVILC